MNQDQDSQTRSHMPRNLAACSIVAALMLALTPALTAQAPVVAVETLRKNFINPPNEDRPMVRWWWFGPAVVKPEILRELQQMKADGIQGAELAFVYAEELDNPATGIKNLSFLSPEMLDDLTYAQAEGRKLGLRIDITLCSGWPYGGPATPLPQAATRLRTAEVPIPAGATSVAVPTLALGKSITEASRMRFMDAGLPKLAEGDSILAAVIVNSIPAPGEAARPAGGRGSNARPPAATWDASSAKPLQFSGSSVTVEPSTTPRTALFFIQSHTGQVVKRAAVGAEGWVLDPFSHDAVATHLKSVGEPLVKAFGATPPYAIFSDSLEAFGADWTPKMPEEFKKRRGYDLVPHLPELVAGGTPEADTIRHDYGKTLTELVNENYLKQIADWAAAHSTKFRSQTYHESAVSFSSQNIPQLAEGEGPQWRAFSTLRWASSANHVFNHVVTSGETFTWLHSPVFRATPLDMKTEADIDFIMGENLIICHGWPYSPPQAFYPGWSLYAAGNFNDNNPWHPVMPAVTTYIGRMSYLMRQGKPANQIAILLPTDDIWASFHPTQTSVTNAMPQVITPALMSSILSAGYNVDYIDAEAVNKVGLGSHQVLILPPTDRIPVETLRKIAAYVKAGGKAIAIGHAPSADPEGKTVAEITTLSKQLFVAVNNTLVPDTAQLTAALNMSVHPDFKITGGDEIAKSQLGFIRRKLPNADIYFVTNTSNLPIDATVNFSTTHKTGQAWDTDSAAIAAATPTGQSIHLAPYESRVFVFGAPTLASKPARASEESQLADLSNDWKVTFVSDNKTVNEATPTDWIADPSTKNYSGEAIYSRDFTLASAPTAPVYLKVDGGKPVQGGPNSSPESPALGPDGLPNPLLTRAAPRDYGYYDAPIREAALVTINGKPAGALWHPPYRIDISQLVKSGTNHIEIHIYNTALNHWASLPPHDYAPLTAKYGDKFQMQDLQLVKPVSSGLLGPVHLITEAE